MGPSHASEAIILRTRSYGESDKIVTFLSLDAGKLTGIAKGAKNSRRRFANCLDPFTRVRAHFRTRPGAGLVFLESCDLLCAPGPLAEPAKLAYGGYLVELVDQLTEEAHPVGGIYHLLAEGLSTLAGGAATGAFLRAFELQLLHHAGYAPPLKSCAGCRQPLATQDQAFFDPAHGGCFCADCRGNRTVMSIGERTLAALNTLKHEALEVARRHRLAPPIAGEAAQLMDHLLAQHLRRPLRSVKLIAALAAPAPAIARAEG